MRSLFLLVCCCCLLNIARAQLLDSLTKTWSEYGDDSLQLAKQIEGAWFLYNQGQYNEGQRLAELNLVQAKSISQVDLERMALLQRAYFAGAKGEVDAFKQYWQDAYLVCNTQNDTICVIDLLNLRAGNYVSELRYDSAFAMYQEALYLAQASNDVFGENQANNDMAIIFAEQGLIEKAKDYFYRAAIVSLNIKDTAGVFLGYNNVARCFIELEQKDSAEFYLAKSVEWITPAYQKQNFALYYENKARLAAKEKNYEEALNNYYRVNYLLSFNTESQGLIKVQGELGKTHFELSQYDSALYYLNLAADRSRKSEINEVLRDVLPLQAKSHAALGDWEFAYENAVSALVLRDKYMKEEVQRQVAEMEAKYQLSNLRSAAEEQEAKIKERTFFAIVGCLGLLLITGLSLLVVNRNGTISKLNQGLESEVESRTKELEQANSKLKGYLEDLQMFTHVTSHDLKEPLRNISGFSSLLQRRLANELTEDTQTFMEMIRSNTMHMHQLIEGIQFYATIGPQKEASELLEEVSLRKLIEQVKEMLLSMINEAQAEVVYAENMPIINAVPDVLIVTLKNLVENGIKYNQSKPPRVEISYRQEGDFHQVLVKDNGIGIAKEYQTQIFEMFKRLHNREEYSGTGMGLGISRKLVQRFHGDIMVNSEEGQGSCFIISLPVEEMV